MGGGLRSIWKGSISFGLVNIPVKLFTATYDKEFSFNQLDNKGHKIQYKKWCPTEDKEIPYSEIKKGYEISKDNYVIIEKEDLDKIKLKTTKTIDIKEFINYNNFDPILVEKSYFIAPDSKASAADKAYSLFVKAIKETDKIAIGKVVLRDNEKLVALRAYQRGMVMHQLRYIDEIKPVNEIEGMPDASQPKIDNKELSLGKTLVENLSSEEFDPSQYSDAYSKQLEQLIASKAQGKTFNSKSDEEDVDTSSNLLEALKASVQKSRSKNK
jgi:DNA end-binding protein Ku